MILVTVGVMPMLVFGGGEGTCDTAGVDGAIKGKCASDQFECCNGMCITLTSNKYYGVDDLVGANNCGDWSDEPNEPGFIKCLCKENNGGLVGCSTTEFVHCPAAGLTRVPTFINPDVDYV